MRLKEDSYSYNSSSIKRRMFRQSPLESIGKRRSKKDTKKWCKGKIGVPHIYLVESESRFHIWTWINLKCSVCGKKSYKSKKT